MKNLRRYERELEREREKLERLIDETMDIPIAENEAILEQSHKVDELVAKLRKEKESIRRSRDDRT